MTALTEKQHEVLVFIKDFIKINHFSPTRAEIGEAFGVMPNAAHERVVALARKGAITMVEGVSRSLVPVKGYRVKVKS